MRNYPKLDRSARGLYDESGEEMDPASPATADKAAKRKANRAAKKEAQ